MRESAKLDEGFNAGRAANRRVEIAVLGQTKTFGETLAGLGSNIMEAFSKGFNDLRQGSSLVSSKLDNARIQQILIGSWYPTLAEQNSMENNKMILDFLGKEIAQATALGLDVSVAAKYLDRANSAVTDNRYYAFKLLRDTYMELSRHIYACDLPTDCGGDGATCTAHECNSSAATVGVGVKEVGRTP